MGLSKKETFILYTAEDLDCKQGYEVYSLPSTP